MGVRQISLLGDKNCIWGYRDKKGKLRDRNCMKCKKRNNNHK